MRFKLDTGRTHKIRVHCAIWVTRSWPMPPTAACRSCDLPHWPSLHAAAPGLDHPISGRAAGVRGPLAADLESLLAESAPGADQSANGCCAAASRRSRSRSVSRSNRSATAMAVSTAKTDWQQQRSKSLLSFKAQQIAVSGVTGQAARKAPPTGDTSVVGRNRTAPSRAGWTRFLGRRAHHQRAGRGCRRAASQRRRPPAVPTACTSSTCNDLNGVVRPAHQSRVCRRCRRRQASSDQPSPISRPSSAMATARRAAAAGRTFLDDRKDQR